MMDKLKTKKPFLQFSKVALDKTLPMIVFV